MQQWLSQLIHIGACDGQRMGSLSRIPLWFHFEHVFHSVSKVFILVRWLDILWCCDSDPTYYGYENDDSDCCDGVGSNHLTLNWIGIVVTYKNSLTSHKIPSFIIKWLQWNQHLINLSWERLETKSQHSSYQVTDTICQSRRENRGGPEKVSAQKKPN